MRLKTIVKNLVKIQAELQKHPDLNYQTDTALSGVVSKINEYVEVQFRKTTSPRKGGSGSRNGRA